MKIIQNHGMAIALSVFVLAVAAFWWLGEFRVYPPTFCPTATLPQRVMSLESPAHTAILIDTSDEVPLEDGTRADSLIDAWVRSDAPALQRLSTYLLPAAAGDPPRDPGLSVCVPKEGEDANWIYENPIIVQAQFERFLFDLKAIYWDLLGRPPADQSPIVETMAELAERHEDIDSFLIVSDMLQHTPLWSHYSRRGDSQDAMEECRRIAAGGRVKAVYVYYINRGLPEEIQDPNWPDIWWSTCMSDIKAVMLNGSV